MSDVRGRSGGAVLCSPARRTTWLQILLVFVEQLLSGYYLLSNERPMFEACISGCPELGMHSPLNMPRSQLACYK